MPSAASKYLATGHHTLSARDALAQPVSVLLGVNADAVLALQKLNIATVFDLAGSAVFKAAVALTDAGDGIRDEGDTHGVTGRVPRDILDDDQLTVPVDELSAKPITVLRAIDPPLSDELTQALQVETVRDLALWPPYRASTDLLNEAYGFGRGADDDPEAPQDLLPRTQRYPTERVHYEVLVLDRLLPLQQSPEHAPAGIPLVEAGPLDVTAPTAHAAGFTTPAVGALLTYSQYW